jgi:N utilization substance protein A
MKLSMDDIMLINALQQVTGVSAKDCFVEDKTVSFVIKNAEMGRAIGKGAINIKQLQEKLNKKIELIPYSEKPEEMAGLALEVAVKSSKTSNGKIFVTIDEKEKPKAFRNIPRLKRLREIMKRNFGLELVIA